MLTFQQKKLLSFIRSYKDAQGIVPTYDEMAEAMGLTSKSPVARLLACLEERGHIRRIPRRARAIEIIDNPHYHFDLNRVGDIALARECRRRGYVIGQWKYPRGKNKPGYIEVLHFGELAPMAREA